jgi:hypothetical protein
MDMSRNSLAFKSPAFKSLALKSLLQRVHFTGQQPLVKARSPLGHFQAIQSQSAPLGWTPQSFDQQETLPLRFSPLGRQTAIALPELFASNQARTPSDRIAEPVDIPATQSALPENSTHPIQPVQTKLETPERDRPSNHPTTSTIQPQVEASPSVLPSIPEQTTRSPLQPTTEVSTDQTSNASPSPIPNPQIALKSETQRSPEPTFDRSNANQNPDSPPLEIAQHRPEKPLISRREDDVTSHPPLIQAKTEPSATTPERSEIATVHARLDASSDRAIAPLEPPSAIATPAPAALQRSTVPSTQREDAEPTARPDKRSPLQADALTPAPSAIQLQADAEAMHQNRGIHSPEQSVVTPHSVQPRLDSQPEAFQATNPPLPAETTAQHPDRTLAIAPQSSELAQPKPDASTASAISPDTNSVSTSATRSPVTSSISPISSHHAALLLKPLGFTKTLVQPTDSTTSQLNVESPNTSQSDLKISSSIDPVQRKESFNSSQLAFQNNLENTDVRIQASDDRSVASSKSGSSHSDTQALLQRRDDQTDPAIAPTFNKNITQTNLDQWSNLSELLDFDPSNHSQSNSINLEDSFDDLSFELNEFGEQSTINSDSSTLSNSKIIRSDPQSASLKSPSGDRPNSSKTLEQQLETLVYPVYCLIQQQRQIEQERHHHVNSSYPNWISDTRLSRLERSPKKNSHPTLLEPIDPGSPLYRKLQLLAQQVYQLVQWQWAIEKERNGYNASN